LVTAVALESTAEAPLLGGAVNVTLTPLAGLPAESVRVTFNGDGKAMLSAADWSVVGETVRIEGGPTRLVRENVEDIPK
jgi:hypothetical protein